VADSAYKFIGIGNFFDDANTDTLSLGENSFLAYYYVDDMCVSIDSTYADNWTGVTEYNKSKDLLRIFPNPFENFLSISFIDQQFFDTNTSVQVFDMCGDLLLQQTANDSNAMEITDLEDLAAGVYLLMIKNKGKLLNQLIIKK
jgi:hypothetical protein